MLGGDLNNTLSIPLQVSNTAFDTVADHQNITRKPITSVTSSANDFSFHNNYHPKKRKIPSIDDGVINGKPCNKIAKIAENYQEYIPLPKTIAQRVINKNVILKISFFKFLEDACYFLIYLLIKYF